MANDPARLISTFLESVIDVAIAPEHKAEVVINLAKAWGLHDDVIRRALRSRLGDDAAAHAFFDWRPAARFGVGDCVRVVDGAPAALGQGGRVTGLDNPRRYGVRGMTRSFAYTVMLDDGGAGWGFQEEQLEPR